MKLKELLSEVTIITKSGDIDIQINTIQHDSRNVSPGDLYVAIKGGTHDGHDYIDAAIWRGATAVVGEIPPPGDGAPYIQVGNTRKAEAKITSAFYGHPWRSMKLIGITGTNGKTSTAHLIESILQEHGIRTGLIGTVVRRIGSEEKNADLTTPESSALHRILYSMFQQKTETVIMEISSHALDQYRVEGLVFRLAMFTNLSHDHLDYHRSMEDYTAAKQRLFTQVDPVEGENIMNGDDPMSQVMAQQNHRPVFTFSAAPGKADVFPVSAHFSLNGIEAVLHTPKGTLDVRSSLAGRHNLYNIMAAASAGLCLGIPAGEITSGIEKVSCIPGRLEPVVEGQSFSVLVDFAHTPDAMEKVMTALRGLITGNLIVVFGCGGDRDKSKRPLMGSIAEQLSDRAILTSDNPRNEDPEHIIQDTLEGVADKDAMDVIIDRTEAIRHALDIAKEADCVLILGKGHELYQAIGTEKIPHDDREVARKLLRIKLHDSNEQIDTAGPFTH